MSILGERFLYCSVERKGCLFGFLGVGAGTGDFDQVAEWGEGELAPLREFAGIERFVVLCFRELKDGMVGKKGLEEYLAGKFRSTGTTCDLSDELEDGFSGAEVGNA